RNKLLKTFLLTGRSSIRGKLIGRKKLRDSDLIRKLLRAGMTFRQIAQIARCSHGSVWAERKAMKKDEEDLKKKIEDQAKTEKALQEASVVFPEISELPSEAQPKL
ncbi:MAG: hypothetical protein AAB966_03925, partial [Patescibacteria group bacterium]